MNESLNQDNFPLDLSVVTGPELPQALKNPLHQYRIYCIHPLHPSLSHLHDDIDDHLPELPVLNPVCYPNPLPVHIPARQPYPQPENQTSDLTKAETETVGPFVDEPDPITKPINEPSLPIPPALPLEATFHEEQPTREAEEPITGSSDLIDDFDSSPDTQVLETSADDDTDVLDLVSLAFRNLKALNDADAPGREPVPPVECQNPPSTETTAFVGSSENSQVYSNSDDRSVIVNFTPTICNVAGFKTTDGPRSRRNIVINRSSPQHIRGNPDHVDGYQLRLLKMVEKKVDLHPQRYNHRNYIETASMLITSRWPSAERLAFCGIPTCPKKAGACRMHQFCPYCCWHVRNQAQFTYVPSFYQGNWHCLTGSFTGQLPLTGCDGYDWLHYWDAYKIGLTALQEESLVDGVYWTEELKINGFLPVRVLPHVHAIIDADELSDGTIQTLTETVNAHLAANIESDHLPPNIKVHPICDEKALLEHIRYMNKTVNLFDAYHEAWEAASGHDRTWNQELNSQLTDLIQGHSLITRKRPKPNFKGTLKPTSKTFIGVKQADHKQHTQLISELKSQPAQWVDDDCEIELSV